MGNTWGEIRTVFGEEFRRTTRRIAFRVMTLAVPVILLVLLIAVPLVRDLTSDGEEGEGEAEAGRIGLFDLSGELLTEEATEEGIRVFPDLEAGVTALVADDIESFFVIPHDYVESGRVEWLRTGSAVTAGFFAEEDTRRIQSWLREALVGGALLAEVKTRFVSPADFESIVVGEEGSTKEGAKEVELLSVSYIFAVMLMMAILTGSGYLLQSVAEEKENRMIEVLLTSVSPLRLMVGKVLALGSVGLLQVIVWAVSIGIMGPRILENFPNLGELTFDPVLLVWLVAFFLAGYFVIGVTYAGIGAATTSFREASQTALLVMMPAMVVPLILFQPIAGNPDSPLAQTLSYIPFTAPITMMLRLGAADISVVETIGSLAVVTLGGIAMLWISARVFRAGLLMYGQRMSLGRVLRTLREAN